MGTIEGKTTHVPRRRMGVEPVITRTMIGIMIEALP